ncbi:hypothetical protein EVAR_48958_1 [Eumeta japonica]|uniref:Reverse transcriptase domain-containing protein n=1 Tax=Eumeta variegata TaxID=151549 RepID=A0A4C1Y617_EUMVA|nr:hypothetical protein EVAR_48958_1 [Eumeta japonica]
MSDKSIKDTIQTVKILMKKQQASKEDLHLVFIDLEEVFDQTLRKLIWQAMRAQKISEHYIILVQDMYDRISTQVRSLAGFSKPFKVELRVHQGSALSLFLFNLSMDYLTWHM